MQGSETHPSELKDSPKKMTLCSNLVQPLGLSKLQSQKGHCPPPGRGLPSSLPNPGDTSGVWPFHSPLCPKHPSASSFPAGSWELLQAPALIILTPSACPSSCSRGTESWGLPHLRMENQRNSARYRESLEPGQEPKAPASWPSPPERATH